METASYRFSGVPLTPAIAAALVVELYQGQISETRVMADAVLSAHTKRGGSPPRSDISRIVKKALSELRVEGAAVNISLGHWQIGSRPDAPDIVMESDLSEPTAVVDALPSDVIELGEGPEAVYLYYLPTYRRFAEQEARSTWPCKIGRTSGDPLARIASQAATALPEPPHMAALLWTTSSAEWERAFHSILAARGKRVLNALGVEWFETSPSDFVEIAVWIDPTLRRSGED